MLSESFEPPKRKPTVWPTGLRTPGGGVKDHLSFSDQMHIATLTPLGGFAFLCSAAWKPSSVEPRLQPSDLPFITPRLPGVLLLLEQTTVGGGPHPCCTTFWPPPSLPSPLPFIKSEGILFISGLWFNGAAWNPLFKYIVLVLPSLTAADVLNGHSA